MTSQARRVTLSRFNDPNNEPHNDGLFFHPGIGLYYFPTVYNDTYTRGEMKVYSGRV